MDYSDFEKKEEKVKEKDENSINLKELIDKNDLEFTKIKTFEQLRTKVLEIKRQYEKTKIDVKDNTENINLISNKLEDIILRKKEQSNKNPTISEESRNNIKNQLSDINKKLNFLLGSNNLDDIKNNEQKQFEQNKNLMNLEEINRRLTKLQFTKVDNVELDSKNEKLINKIDDVERKMNELIFGLYGDYELHNNDDSNNKRITFVMKDEFDEYKTNTEEEFRKIWENIDKLKRTIENFFEHLNEKASLKDLDNMKNYLLQKVEELIMSLNKKYVDKNENALAFKSLEDQFKKIIMLLATKAEHQNDKWLLAKKPINGFSCAACESFIGELKEEQNNKHIHWNKLPLREREKEQEKEKERIYRLGNGYSKILKMVGVDNSGNVSLNPSSEVEMNSLFDGINDNTKIKGRFNLQIQTGFERIQSAHSNSKGKEKTIDVNRTKNFQERKLPKIKNSMSSDNFDKIIENPNPNLNIINFNGSNTNLINPKITKILRKTQTKFNA